MKKICIFTCGGTITMKKNKNNTLAPFYNSKILLEKTPYLNKIAQISLKEIINIDSTNIEPDFWHRLATLIKDNYNKYDGFIVTHGTDTMAYSASALSFALGNLDKPVIFTGSQKTVDDIPSDAVNNLINSTIVSTFDLAGVFIVFGSKILQGNRTTKVSESSLEAFDSPMVAPVGDISLEPQLINYRKKIKTVSLLNCKTDFDPNVITVTVTPGLSTNYLEILIDNCKGIILQGFGPGNIPTTLLTFFKKAKKLNKPVVIISQCKKGITKMQLYAVGYNALKHGAIPGNDMTIEAAVAKLMWMLRQTNNINLIKQAFNKNYFGEVTV